MDQELTRRNINPIFGNNYNNKYEKEEFLIDVDMEFFKLKKLLERSPNVLKEDPILAVDYLKIIQVIRRKKLLEFSGNHYDPANQFYTTYHDQNILDKEKLKKARANIDRFNLDRLTEMQSGNDTRLSATPEAVDEEKIKKEKKMAARDQYKIVQQFDKLATAFEKKGAVDQSGAKVTQRRGAKVTEVKMTAGMLKKKNKVKKEKSLSAKLRLKEKKGK